MALVLKTVEAARGLRWIGDAWRLFRKKPLPFLGMGAMVIVVANLAALVPLLALLLLLIAPLLVGLGFMIAGQAALLGSPVHPKAFIEPLRTDAARRRSLLLLGLLYAALLTAITALGAGIAGDSWERLAELQQKPRTEATQAEIMAVLSEGGAGTAALVVGVLWLAVTLVYWHAPPLVHWGGQGPGQALFSSLLGVWRNRGAFALYLVGLLGNVVLVALVAVLAASLLAGIPFLANVVVLTAVATSVAVYNLSLLFSFNDSYGGAPLAASGEEVQVPEA
jgi:hypothetical protein